MDAAIVERVELLGLSASVIKDRGWMAMIDARLGAEAPEEITSGQAVARMLLNGLGCAKRPLSFTPQVFANTPLALWFHEGVGAEMCNRLTRDRPLDKVHTSGGERYQEAHAASLSPLGLITRMPQTL